MCSTAGKWNIQSGATHSTYKADAWMQHMLVTHGERNYHGLGSVNASHTFLGLSR